MIILLIFIVLYFVFRKIGPSKTLLIILIVFCSFPDGIIDYNFSGGHLTSFYNLFSNTYLLVNFLSIYGFIWYSYLPNKLKKTYFLILFLIVFPQLFSTFLSLIEKFLGFSIISRDVGIIGNLIGTFTRYVAPFGLLPIGFLIAKNQNEKYFFINKTLPIISCFGIFLSIYGILQLFSPYRFIELSDQYIYQQFRLTHLASRDPNGSVRSLIFPLISSYVLSYMFKKKIYYFNFFLILSAIILTFSRSGWISVGMSLLILYLIVLKSQKKRILTVITITIIFVLFSFLYENRTQIFGYYDEYESLRVKSISTFEDRLYLWKLGIESLRFLTLILGNGPYSGQFYTGLEEGSFVMTSIHNTYLFYFYEMGIFSSIALIILIYQFFKLYIQLPIFLNDNFNIKIVFRLFSLGLVVFTILHSFVEPSTVFYISLSLGFISGLKYNSDND